MVTEQLTKIKVFILVQYIDGNIFHWTYSYYSCLEKKDQLDNISSSMLNNAYR